MPRESDCEQIREKLRACLRKAPINHLARQQARIARAEPAASAAAAASAQQPRCAQSAADSWIIRKMQSEAGVHCVLFGKLRTRNGATAIHQALAASKRAADQRRRLFDRHTRICVCATKGISYNIARAESFYILFTLRALVACLREHAARGVCVYTTSLVWINSLSFSLSLSIKVNWVHKICAAQIAWCATLFSTA